MSTPIAIALAVVVVALVGGVILYQRQTAAAAALAASRTPGAMIATGIGSLVGGIVNAATGSGGV